MHDRYLGVLETMKESQCSLTEAMGLFGVPRNILRDFIGICELRIIDKEKYDRVVQSVRERTGKTSMKLIELKCREALSDYRAQASKFKTEEKLLPFYPKVVIFIYRFYSFKGHVYSFFFWRGTLITFFGFHRVVSLLLLLFGF